MTLRRDVTGCICDVKRVRADGAVGAIAIQVKHPTARVKLLNSSPPPSRRHPSPSRRGAVPCPAISGPVFVASCARLELPRIVPRSRGARVHTCVERYFFFLQLFPPPCYRVPPVSWTPSCNRVSGFAKFAVTCSRIGDANYALARRPKEKQGYFISRIESFRRYSRDVFWNRSVNRKS